mgnify:CR=1 FL=1
MKFFFHENRSKWFEGTCSLFNFQFLNGLQMLAAMSPNSFQTVAARLLRRRIDFWLGQKDFLLGNTSKTEGDVATTKGWRQKCRQPIS